MSRHVNWLLEQQISFCFKINLAFHHVHIRIDQTMINSIVKHQTLVDANLLRKVSHTVRRFVYISAQHRWLLIILLVYRCVQSNPSSLIPHIANQLAVAATIKLCNNNRVQAMFARNHAICMLTAFLNYESVCQHALPIYHTPLVPLA